MTCSLLVFPYNFIVFVGSRFGFRLCFSTFVRGLYGPGYIFTHVGQTVVGNYLRATQKISVVREFEYRPGKF